MIPRPRSRRHAAGERSRAQHGFTVAELLTVIVIMGLILAPLSIMLTQSLKVIPESERRTDRALDASRLVQQFSEDVSELTQPPGLAGTLHCGDTPADWLASNYWWFLGWKQPGSQPKVQVLYRSTFTAVGGGTRRVTLSRVTNVVPGGTATTDVMLTGYCRGDEIVVAGRETPGSARRYGLTITLRPAADQAPQTLALDAAARSTNIP